MEFFFLLRIFKLVVLQRCAVVFPFLIRPHASHCAKFHRTLVFCNGSCELVSCVHVTAVVLASCDRNCMKCHVKERELDYSMHCVIKDILNV